MKQRHKKRRVFLDRKAGLSKRKFDHRLMAEFKRAFDDALGFTSKTVTKIGDDLAFMFAFSGLPVIPNDKTNPTFTYSTTPPRTATMALDRKWADMLKEAAAPPRGFSRSEMEMINKVLKRVDQETIDALRPMYPEVDLYDTAVFREYKTGKIRILTGCVPVPG